MSINGNGVATNTSPLSNRDPVSPGSRKSSVSRCIVSGIADGGASFHNPLPVITPLFAEPARLDDKNRQRTFNTPNSRGPAGATALLAPRIGTTSIVPATGLTDTGHVHPLKHPTMNAL